MEAPSGRPRGRVRSAIGFTLIELLTVIAIIVILAGIMIGVGRRASETGRIARAKAELVSLAVALESYRRIYGDYPQTDDEARLLQSLLGRRGPTNAAIDGRTLIDTAKFVFAPAGDPMTNPAAMLVDPWGKSYVYAYKTPASGWSNSGYILYSVGPDGADAPGLMPGGFSDPAAPANVDNLYANNP